MSALPALGMKSALALHKNSLHASTCWNLHTTVTCAVSERHHDVCLHNLQSHGAATEASTMTDKLQKILLQTKKLATTALAAILFCNIEPAYLLSERCFHFYDPMSSVLVPSHIGESSPGVPPCPARFIPWAGLQQGPRYRHDLAAHSLQTCPQRMQPVCCERLASCRLA